MHHASIRVASCVLVHLILFVPSSTPLAASPLLPLGAKGASMATSRRTLITFDIDGTIVRQAGPDANAMHTRAFAHAFNEVFGLDASIDEVKHAGSTDPLILCKVLAHRGLSIENDVGPKLPQLKSAMVSYAEKHRQSAAEGLELLPGVKELLEELAERQDVRVGLVTGILEPIAWAKMDALGIRHLFSKPAFGGFGSDFCSLNPDDPSGDRAQLVRRAAERSSALHHHPARADARARSRCRVWSCRRGRRQQHPSSVCS